MSTTRRPGRPIGLKWRSSVWFTTFVVGLGISTDILVYTIVIPVLPFRLEKLGYIGVSSLVGWLLFSYSAGLVAGTMPIAMFSERYDIRRMPLIIGLVTLLASQVMLMEAPVYWLMCVARVLQGLSSSMVWVVGLALLCDAAHESRVGRQLGIAMTGLSLGFVVGPPVGGVLYGRLGWRAPIIFGEVCTLLDLIGRFLIIERKDALLYGIDPKLLPGDDPSSTSGAEDTEDLGVSDTDANGGMGGPLAPSLEPGKIEEGTPPFIHGDTATVAESQLTSIPTQVEHLSLPAVIGKLFTSPRAVMALFLTAVYGIVYSSQEPALPLHLQDVWNYDSTKVGLVMLAAVVPTLISSPLSGWIADVKGTEWVTVFSLILSIPWWALITLQSSLPLFIVAFAIEMFFTSAVVSPVTAELAAVSRGIEGVGYAHVYGAFNLVYGIGTAVGPIIGGQLYDHIKHGWTAICLIGVALIALSAMLSVCFTGSDPLLSRLRRRGKDRRGVESST